MKDIKDLRSKIDQLDDEITNLYLERLKVCKEIGILKALCEICKALFFIYPILKNHTDSICNKCKYPGKYALSYHNHKCPFPTKFSLDRSNCCNTRGIKQ